MCIFHQGVPIIDIYLLDFPRCRIEDQSVNPWVGVWDVGVSVGLESSLLDDSCLVEIEALLSDVKLYEPLVPFFFIRNCIELISMKSVHISYV